LKEINKAAFGSADIKLTTAEIQMFEKISRFSCGNARKIKRLSNLFSLLKITLGGKIVADDFKEKLLVWMLICEFWPVRASWILNIFEEKVLLYYDERDYLMSMSLSSFYCTYVKSSMTSSLKTMWPEALKSQNDHILTIDNDGHLFEKLIGGYAWSREVKLLMSDVGSSDETSSLKLIFCSFNLNPALFSAVKRMRAYQIDNTLEVKEVGLRFADLSDFTVACLRKYISSVKQSLLQCCKMATSIFPKNPMLPAITVQPFFDTLDTFSCKFAVIVQLHRNKNIDYSCADQST